MSPSTPAGVHWQEHLTETPLSSHRWPGGRWPLRSAFASTEDDGPSDGQDLRAVLAGWAWLGGYFPEYRMWDPKTSSGTRELSRDRVRAVPNDTGCRSAFTHTLHVSTTAVDTTQTRP